MKIVRKSIKIKDFIDLWDDIRDRKWDKVMPGFWDGVKKAWTNEIHERFRQMKRGGSYGPLTNYMLKTLLQNTQNTFLPRGLSYHPGYARRFPVTYKKTGFLEKQMQNTSAVYEDVFEKDGVGVTVKIPLKLSMQRGGSYGYADLEEKRSFIKSSFVLAWPKIIDATLKSIGER
jgi:hypothetical protein